LYVRVSRDDKELLETVAKQKRLTVSALARMLIFDGLASLGYHEKPALGAVIEDARSRRTQTS
jgi:hypothetical protein